MWASAERCSCELVSFAFTAGDRGHTWLLGGLTQVSKDFVFWGKRWAEHPVTLADPSRKVLPLALYSDGLQFGKRSNCQGYWICNLATGKRFLIGALRTTMLCDCSCHGYCSFHAMQSFIAWVLEHLAKGKHPSSRLNGDPWSAEDLCSSLAGSSMRLKAICIVVKADWADFGNTFSFYGHNHHQHPCFLCDARAGPESNWNVFAGC